MSNIFFNLQQAIMETIKIKTAQNIDIDYEVAGLGERILAYLIDFGIFFALYLFILFSNLIWVSGGSMFENDMFKIVMIIWVACYALYDLVCEIFLNGQSIGKRIIKIRTISLDGGSPRLGQYFLRWLFRIIDFPVTIWLTGALSIAFTENKQRLGDLVAGTTLIKVNPRTTLDHLNFSAIEEGYTPLFPQASELKENEIALIVEVLNNFKSSDNHTLLYTTAAKIKSHLNITSSQENEDFLRTILKDYHYSHSLLTSL